MALALGRTYLFSYQDNKSFGTDTSNTYFGETKKRNPFALTLSVLPLVGVNYYIAPRFAIGTEYRLSIASTTYTGKSSTIATPSSPSSLYPNQTTHNDELFSFNGNLTGTAYITLTLFFH
jgi:hypothetical protein